MIEGGVSIGTRRYVVLKSRAQVHVANAMFYSRRERGKKENVENQIAQLSKKCTLHSLRFGLDQPLFSPKSAFLIFNLSISTLPSICSSRVGLLEFLANVDQSVTIVSIDIALEIPTSRHHAYSEERCPALSTRSFFLREEWVSRLSECLATYDDLILTLWSWFSCAHSQPRWCLSY